jgi:citrate lyase beta subunit
MELLHSLRPKDIGIMLPKCGNDEDLKSVEEFHRPLVPIIPTIETIEGFEYRNNIFDLSKKIGVKCIAFGAGDMSLDLGIERNYALPVLRHVICALLVSAKRYKLDLIDSPSRVLPGKGSDWEQLIAEECVFASDNGFSGKLAIHPSQVRIIEQVFNSESKIERARKVLADFENNPQTQTVRSSETGDYIGTPVLRYAKWILQSNKMQEK